VRPGFHLVCVASESEAGRTGGRLMQRFWASQCGKCSTV
jgi:hypothetical protein